MPFSKQTFSATFFIFVLMMTTALFGQQAGSSQGLHFKFEPSIVQLGVGDTVTVKVQLLTKSGQSSDMPFLLYARGVAARSVEVIPRVVRGGSVDATVIAHRPGKFDINARTVTVNRDDRLSAKLAVNIAFPPLQKITFTNLPRQLYSGTTVSIKTQVWDAAGLARKGVHVTLTSDNPEIASTDAFGNITAHKAGAITLAAAVDNIRETVKMKIVANPVEKLELTSSLEKARTGDVIQFRAGARNSLGQAVDDAPISFSVIGTPPDRRGTPASALIEQDGRFVAETPGLYTVIANSGPHSERLTVSIRQRNLNKKIELVGHGEVLDVYTSDLWVWEGVDGRDYAVTGTWGANGDAYFWDVTDPENMRTIDTVHVDARTVNDVKVSQDGRIAVISREGASNRKNGIVILDVSNPADVKILSRFDDQLTGGVHNVFIYDNHVYAVNNSVRYDVINIEDPENPYREGRFELSTPGHGVHDVWIENGIAFSSNWQDGVRLVDIGGVTAGRPFRKFGETASPEINTPFAGGGSPSNPLQFAGYEYPSGWNHAAFPFYNKDTRKFYVVAGDEAFPYGLDGPRLRKPEIAAGWLHFIDFTDPLKPKETARYEVPEAGSHNFWIENGILYAAFYNGGLRVVDVSGDLMGDLYKQGREIGWFLPMHRDAIIPNAPMVWGAQPHKGVVFLADMNSGLWAVRIVDKKEDRGGTP
ncbi:MAG: LVIVD repeat-containing protein [bacterium]